jgi:ABC-type transport system involved in multi-copper enzyme maturation permease subunit
MITFTAAGFAIFTALHLTVYAILGIGAQGLALRMVLAIAFQQFLLTVGFALIASVVVYGTQKPTYAVVTYFMLAFNVVTMLVRMLESMVHINLGEHLLSGTTSAIMLGMVSPGTNLVAPALEFTAYLVLAIAASIFVFKKREMEF